MQNEPLEVTLKVTGALEALGVPYFITGSFASSLYGVVRATRDADIVADLREEHIEALVSALRDEFYADEEMIAEAIQTRSSFNLIHLDTAFKVDVFVPAPTPFAQSQMARAQRQTFALTCQASARFASVEDTILAKLIWYRLGSEASAQQWRDILGILRIRADDLDLGYLTYWAGETGVGELLQRALRECGSD